MRISRDAIAQPRPLALSGSLPKARAVNPPKRIKRKTVRYSLLAGNVLLLIVIAVSIFSQTTAGVENKSSVMVASPSADITNPLDTLSSAEIAASVAHLTALPETTIVQNQADSDAINMAYQVSTDGVAAKPEVVDTSANDKSIKDIVHYTAVNGDTVSGLAVKFGVTSDSIRWSNGLGNYTTSIAAGTKLVIPPVDGIVYTVKTGDTAASLAQKYGTDKQKLIAFNDAELTGLKVGEQIVIPDGVEDLPTYATYGGFAFGSTAIYGYNGYDPGNCTWYAANRRAAMGRPLPANLGNAVTWVKGAQLAGLSTGHVPQPGAVFWVPPSMLGGYWSYYGHVGIVDAVLPDGSAKLSSMNVNGLYSMGYQTLTPAQAAEYTYIY